MTDTKITHDAPTALVESPQFRPSHETAVAAVEAHARAAIESRYIIAMKRPRDLDDARVALLKECDRPGFADVAIYNKPIGKGIEGLSIRFAEAAIAAMKNIYVESPAVYDDSDQRIVRVSVTDLENNVSYSQDVTIRKQVERRKLVEGEVAISSRRNSYGDMVYLRKATDDEIIDRQGALISKALRTQALRVVPGWMQQECLDRCYQTIRTSDAEDPDAVKRRLSDAFGKLGIWPSDLKAYLGHELEHCPAAELVELRGILAAIRDGEANWRQVMDNRRGGEPTPKGSRTEELKADLEKEASSDEKQPSSPPVEETATEATGDTPQEPEASAEQPAASESKAGKGKKTTRKTGAKAAKPPARPDSESAEAYGAICEAIGQAKSGGDLNTAMKEIRQQQKLGVLDKAQGQELMALVHELGQKISKGTKP